MRLHGKSKSPENRKTEEFIYGVNPVLEAIKSGRKINTIYIYNRSYEHLKYVIKTAEAGNIPVKFAEKDFFDARFPKGHQGIAAVVGKRKLMSVEDLFDISDKKNEPSFFLVLDCIEDPRNFGAILRSADAAGAHGIIFQSHRSARISPVVSKASAGALEHMNLAEVVNIKHAMEKLKARDVLIVGAEADSELTLWDIDMKVPIAFVIGSEGLGLRRTVKEMCDAVVRLPMMGNVNSLNVSVAAGILCYELMRQRLRE
jgi:23S rRNA (guanosine2251-2'-O)-methyltransferase